MLIFISGKNTYDSRAKLHELVEHFKAKFDPNNMNLDVFRDDLNKGNISQAVSAVPFMSEKRMVVVEGLLSSVKKDGLNDWLPIFSNLSGNNIVIFWDEGSLNRKSLATALKKKSEVLEYPFDELKGAELNRWVTARVKELGGKIDPNTVGELIGHVGDDLWQMNSEIEKLVAYSNDQPITTDMVKQLVQGNVDDVIFDFIDAVSNKQEKRMFELLEKERASGAEDGYILSMLARQIRILLRTKSLLSQNKTADKSTVASELGLHPFVAGKALTQATRFTASDLMKAHEALVKIDVDIKTGKSKTGTAVDQFIISLV